MSCSTVRVLQISDVHFDSDLSASRLGLPPDKGEQRQQELKEIFAQAMEIAKERYVDAILLPGDLWDDEGVRPETVAFVGEQFRKLEGIPVFIAPGNHDFYAPGCGYDSSFWSINRIQPWPDNVHVFTSGDFTTVGMPTRSDVSVTGRAFRQNVTIEERLVRKPIVRVPTTISLLLFHGSRLGYEAGKRVITAPFSDTELLQQGFSYTALGHYHRHQVVGDERGCIRTAYSGCPAGRTLAEYGEKGCLILEIDAEGVQPDKKEFHVLDRRRILRLSVDITGADHQSAIKERIHRELQKKEAHSEDILYIELIGRYPPAVQPNFTQEFLADSFFHVRSVSTAEPDYDLEGYRKGWAKTVEARFAREFLSRLENTRDHLERAKLREALYLGLDALVRGQITVREFVEPSEGEGEP